MNEKSTIYYERLGRATDKAWLVANLMEEMLKTEIEVNRDGIYLIFKSKFADLATPLYWVSLVFQMKSDVVDGDEHDEYDLFFNCVQLSLVRHNAASIQACYNVAKDQWSFVVFETDSVFQDLFCSRLSGLAEKIKNPALALELTTEQALEIMKQMIDFEVDQPNIP